MADRFVIHTRTRRLVSVLVAALALHSVGARAGGAIAGATEPTQIANNIELMMSVAKQTQMVAEQIATRMTQIQQLQTMMRNLQQLPANLMQQALAPYESQLAAFGQLQGAVKDLGYAADNTRAMFESRGLDFRASGKDLRSYVQYEIALAQRKGGIYKQRLDQDIAAMDSMRQKSEQLRSVAARTAQITGNVEGLQHLSQLSAMSTGELMEIKAALLAQSADNNQQKHAEQDSQKSKSLVADATVRAARERKERDAKAAVSLGDPAKPWSTLEQAR